MKSIDRFTHRLVSVRFLPEVLALLGGLAYLVHAWGHVHGQVSVLDEGLYLFKGYQFALGNYQPFQDYGPLTNHMPLSFLIPGWVQVLFGTGLRTARYYALSLGILIIVGLWVASRRFTSPWWAAFGVWAVALNPALVKIYSQATSQVLISAMLIWALAFTLGDGRKPWQLFLGTLLGGLIVLTRINMLPFLPLLIAYIFWQHGRKSGFWSLIIGAMVILLGHAAYWPDILKLWSNWIPSSLTPFLNSFRETAGGEPAWGPVNLSGNRFWILFDSLRMHLLSALGLISFWLIFQFNSKNCEKKNRPQNWFVLVCPLPNLDDNTHMGIPGTEVLPILFKKLFCVLPPCRFTAIYSYGEICSQNDIPISGSSAGSNSSYCAHCVWCNA